MTRNPTSAFSYIELVLALVVIGLAQLPILSTYSASHQNTRATLEEVTSVNFASELIEALQALPFDQLCLMDAEVTFNNGVFAPDPFATAALSGNQHGMSSRPLPPEFSTHVFVDSYPVSGMLVKDSAMLRIAVTVSWGARNRRIQLITLKGRY